MMSNRKTACTMVQLSEEEKSKLLELARKYENSMSGILRLSFRKFLEGENKEDQNAN